MRAILHRSRGFVIALMCAIALTLVTPAAAPLEAMAPSSSMAITINAAQDTAAAAPATMAVQPLSGSLLSPAIPLIAALVVMLATQVVKLWVIPRMQDWSSWKQQGVVQGVSLILSTLAAILGVTIPEGMAILSPEAISIIVETALMAGLGGMGLHGVVTPRKAAA